MRRALIPAVMIAIVALSATVSADDPEPLTLSALSNRATCTLGSVTTIDYAIEGGVPPYRLTVDGREVATGTDLGLIRCRDSTIGSPFESTSGAGARYIAVNATDSTGARAFQVIHVPLVKLPAPRHVVAESQDQGSFGTFVSARWWAPRRSKQDSAADFVIRWRFSAGDEWRYEQRRTWKEAPGLNAGSFTIHESTRWKPLEVQVAQVIHPLDLQAPDALAWSLSAHIPIVEVPRNLQAKSTHDSISVSWGPHPSGLSYRAELVVVDDSSYGYWRTREVIDESPYRAHFVDLLPDTLYRVGVCLTGVDRDVPDWCWIRDENQFELRTDPAPDGWKGPSRLPTNINASLVDGKIEVSWTPPETGSRHDTRVCARESDTIDDVSSWRCDSVGPGLNRARVSALNNRWGGGSFQIQVSTLTDPAGTAHTELHLPSYSPELANRGGPPDAPKFAEVGWINIADDYSPRNVAVWTFEWPMDGASLAELSWWEEDHNFLRETRQTRLGDRDTGYFRIGTDFYVRPKSIRIRLLRDGAWTPWSQPVDAPNMGGPIFGVRLSEGPDGIEAQWNPPAFGTEIDGYRLYVSRNGGSDEVLEVGTATRALIPILPQDERYFVRVVSYSEAHGEGGSGYDWHTCRAQPNALAISLREIGSWCPPVAGGRTNVNWSIEGGTPPFTVAIANKLGFETEDRSGSSTIACPERVADIGPLLRAHVMDAEGKSADDTIVLYDFLGGSDEVDEDPFAVHVDLRSVHRDRVLLRWDCRYLPYTAALRWRQAGESSWAYATGFTQSRGGHGDYRCRGTWDDLQPLTDYEYQLAHYDRMQQLRRPELLRWTDTQTVTTLGEPVDPRIEREGETVAVSWERQPDAWAYVVRLRGGGQTWWKRYEPSGDLRETVRFFHIPEDLGLSVELISPPLDHGEEARPYGYDYVELGH